MVGLLKRKNHTLRTIRETVADNRGFKNFIRLLFTTLKILKLRGFFAFSLRTTTQGVFISTLKYFKEFAYQLFLSFLSLVCILDKIPHKIVDDLLCVL